MAIRKGTAEIHCLEIWGLNRPTDQPTNKEKKCCAKTDSRMPVGQAGS